MESSRHPFTWPISPDSIAREMAQFERELAEAEATHGSESREVLAARAKLGRAYLFASRDLDATKLVRITLMPSGLGPTSA